MNITTSTFLYVKTLRIMLSLLVLSLMTVFSIGPVSAAEPVELVCTNAGAIETLDDFQNNCNLDPLEGFGFQPLLDIVSAVDSCTEGEGTVTCEASGNVTLTCTTDAEGTSTCVFPDNTAVVCSEEQSTGTVTCNIAPDADLGDKFGTALSTAGINFPAIEMARVLTDICPSRRANSDLQRECDSLIGLLNPKFSS